MDGITKFLDIDPRGFDDGPLKAVALLNASEVNQVDIAGSVTRTVELAVSNISNLVELTSGHAVDGRTMGGSHGAEICTNSSNSVVEVDSFGLERKSAVVNEGAQLIAHPFREGGLLNKIHPRGGVEGGLVNIGTNASSFSSQHCVNCGCGISLKSVR